MIASKQEAFASIEEWLLMKSPDHKVIDFELDLIENRVIDSLHFVDFVFLLEELTGKEISFDSFSLDQIRSLKAIEENFF